MAYSNKLQKYFNDTGNIGQLDENDRDVGSGLVGSPACGDVMRFYIKVNKSGIVESAKHMTFGCGAAIASSNFLIESVIGKHKDDLRSITNNHIAKELSLPPIKKHCSVLAEKAIKKALTDLQNKEQNA